MFTFLTRIVSSFRVAPLWNRALDKAAAEKNAEAMSYLLLIYKTFDTLAPSEKVPFEINLLLAHVAMALENYDLSIAAIRVSLKQINSKAAKLSLADKQYLLYFCKIILEYCSIKTNYEIFLESKNIDVKFSDLMPKKVRSDLKRKFPVIAPVPSENL